MNRYTMRRTAMSPVIASPMILQILSQATVYKAHSPKNAVAVIRYTMSVIIGLLLRQGVGSFKREREHAPHSLFAFHPHHSAVGVDNSVHY
jgi:hypothetical protein